LPKDLLVLIQQFTANPATSWLIQQLPGQNQFFSIFSKTSKRIGKQALAFVWNANAHNLTVSI